MPFLRMIPTEAWRWQNLKDCKIDSITGAVTGIPSDALGGQDFMVTLDPVLGYSVVMVRTAGRWAMPKQEKGKLIS